MIEIDIPAYGWTPREKQQEAWNYLQLGGKHAELIWHRRWGKDEIAMQHAAISMCERPGTYWHMLPMANQVKKAIWKAVNPRTGRRRIDDVFPDELFNKNDTDMMVTAKFNASTWQCLGSDNFQGAIGSPPVGIVYSEWSQANPSARGYLRPIITENNGWQIFITTPRGKNHAYRTFNAAKKLKDSFAQILTVEDTGALTPEQLKVELEEYISTYGQDQGEALYEQEYFCSFDAAILGAYYGSEFKKIDQEGRIRVVQHNADRPVHTAWDIGYDDDTAIYWYQVIGNEIHILDYYANNFKDPDHYASQVLGKEVKINLIDGEIVTTIGDNIEGLQHRREYEYGKHWLPHDAKAETFAAKGKSIIEQLAAVWGISKMAIVPGLSKQDGIQATRKLLGRAYFDELRCEEGIEAVRQYQREWDDNKKMFKDNPLHDWTSHAADALRYLAIAWRKDTKDPIKEVGRTITVNEPSTMTLNDMWEANEKYINRTERI